MASSRKRGSVVGWLALILAAAALVLSIIAFNRTGVDVDEVVASQVEAATADLQDNIKGVRADLEAARENASRVGENAQAAVETAAEAIREGAAAVSREGQQETSEGAKAVDAVTRTELDIARAAAASRLNAPGLREETEVGTLERELAETRTALGEAYEAVGAEAQDEWEDLQANFDRVEAVLRDDTGDALQALQRLIERLEQDIRTD